MKAAVAGFSAVVCLLSPMAERRRAIPQQPGIRERQYRCAGGSAGTVLRRARGSVRLGRNDQRGRRRDRRRRADSSGGIRAGRAAFGVGYSHTRTEGSHDFTASTTPFSPGSFTRSVNGVTPDLEHDERMVYAFAGLVKSVGKRFDFMVSGGPAFFHVTQGVPAKHHPHRVSPPA